jgi:hypothetical protein
MPDEPNSSSVVWKSGSAISTITSFFGAAFVPISREVSDAHVALLKWAADHQNVVPGSLFTFTDDNQNPLRENPRLNHVLLWPELPVFPDATLRGQLRGKGDTVLPLALVPLYEEEAHRYWSDKAEYIPHVQERYHQFWILDEQRETFVVA